MLWIDAYTVASPVTGTTTGTGENSLKAHSLKRETEMNSPAVRAQYSEQREESSECVTLVHGTGRGAQ